VAYVDWFAISVGLHFDPGHITFFDGEYMVSPGTLCFDINTRVKMITADFSKITWEVDGDFYWWMKGGTILSAAMKHKELE